MEIAHVYIYGVIDYWQDDYASEWGYVNLKDVKNQIDAQKDAKEIVVHIHSPGGSVTEGFAIHDLLRSQGLPVTTKIEGTCYSIATVIALSGDKRLMTSNAEFMIHNPWGMASGDKEDIKKYADQLEEAENQIADFYAAKTKITKEEALTLMKEETFMDVETAINHGFVTEEDVTMKAVALFNPKAKKDKPNKKSKNSNSKKNAMSLVKKIKNLISSEESLNLSLTAADGTILSVETEADNPAVGDPIVDSDGKSITDGEVVMADGSTLVVESGKISDIKEKEDPQNIGQEQFDALNEKIEALTKAIGVIADAVEGNQNNYKSLAKNVKSKNFTPPKAPQTPKGGSDEPQDLYEKIQAQLAEKEDKKNDKKEE